MYPSDFIAALEAQRRVVPWLHTVDPPVASTEVLAWSRAYECHVLPADLLALYYAANGFALRHIRYRSDIVGEAFVVPSLRMVEPINHAMFGRHGRRHHAVPSHWFAVGRHTEGSPFVALDPQDSTYRTVEPIVPEEAEVIARNCSEYLEWLGQFLLSESELSAMERESTT